MVHGGATPILSTYKLRFLSGCISIKASSLRESYNSFLRKSGAKLKQGDMTFDGRRAGGGGMDGCGLVGSQTDENLTSANWELNWKSHGHSPQLVKQFLWLLQLLTNGEGCRMLRNGWGHGMAVAGEDEGRCNVRLGRCLRA
ncbi:hypothetical protein Gogos_010841 [Gossypium gossypioides]|uniref:Uncharacterized protein n=1 Tax=Gossypium gossypioides TaxID=34282 RepID=A0A7J9BMK8_GOSGO|nr:hypothetical protein [Gossypium gossypioides]